MVTFAVNVDVPPASNGVEEAVSSIDNLPSAAHAGALREKNVLSFNFDKVPGSSFTISLPIGLCNKWGYSAGAGTVKITYNPSSPSTSLLSISNARGYCLLSCDK